MRLTEETVATPMSTILNPRGQLAKELEATAKKASWLMLVCEHWLAHKGGDYTAARSDEPTYNLPKAFEDAARFNKARKMCGAWEHTGSRTAMYKYKVAKDGTGKWVRGGRAMDVAETVPASVPSFASRWVWSEVFDSWFFGGMAENIERLKGSLPLVNVELIEMEVIK